MAKNRLGQAGKDNRTAGHEIHLEIEDVLYKKIDATIDLQNWSPLDN